MKEPMPKELDFIQMGKRIRAQREDLGLTREKLAEKLSVSSKFIADIENGVKGISIKKFFALIQILGVSADYLLTGIDDGPREERDAIMETIVEQLRGCNDAQLECMEAIAKYYVKSHK